MKKTRSKQLPE